MGNTSDMKGLWSFWSKLIGLGVPVGTYRDFAIRTRLMYRDQVFEKRLQEMGV